MQFYSQHGEDRLLWELFDHAPNGFFVDVGAMDGVHLSNTYFFEKMGWGGICVEPHPDYVALLQQCRPGSTIVNSAVHSVNRNKVAFYKNKWGAFSTLDSTLETRFERFGKWFAGWEKVDVRMETLTSILDNREVTEIDFLSVDVDGTDVHVLRGLDFTKYRPRIVIVESMKKHDDLPRDKHMKSVGYFRARKLGCNIFYCRDKADVIRVKSIKIRHKQTTTHPLGSPE